MTIEIRLISQRCNTCGKFYAVENNAHSYTCPYCAVDRRDKLEDEVRKLKAKVKKAWRVRG